mmetsp:Transcript_2717/g.3948  ORF Transcript_2717/g.3948 Transcript_2717/m.3948 type:complete len:192 (+) Transcript_2717:1278-1853(+)
MASSISSKQFTVCVVGGGAVGKSNLCMRFMYDQFQETYDPTIEDVYRRQLDIDGDSVMLEILDTAGREEFVPMRWQWIAEGEGFLLVYAINRKDTLQAALDYFKQVQQVKESETNVPVVIAGNKCDLEAERQITLDEARTKAAMFGDIKVFETSAKTGDGVKEAFNHLARLILKKRSSSKVGKKRSVCTLL